LNRPIKFDPSTHTIGITSDLSAELVPARPDPPIAVNGLTVGIASMSENAPHGGEMHPDGDEVLYLISGHVKVVFEDQSFDDIEMLPGEGLIVPRGVWHRVDILEPSQVVYATPGPRGEYRPL
jgi:mannose-6-phosphate isomerase-like protein (cupin superfamily)